jgi:hypothetical protein
MLFAIDTRLLEIEKQIQVLAAQAKQIKTVKVLVNNVVTSLQDAVNVAKESTPDLVELLKQDIIENLNSLLDINSEETAIATTEEAIAPVEIMPEVTESELEAEGFEVVEEEPEPESIKQLDLVEAIAESPLFKVNDIVVKTDKNQRGVCMICGIKDDGNISLTCVRRLAKFNDNQQLEIYNSPSLDESEVLTVSPQEICPYNSEIVPHVINKYGVNKIIEERDPFSSPLYCSLAYHVIFEGLTYQEVYNICEELKIALGVKKYLVNRQYIGKNRETETISASFTLEDKKFSAYGAFECEIMQVAYIHDKNKKKTNNETLTQPNNEIHADQVAIDRHDVASFYYVEKVEGSYAYLQDCYPDEYGNPVFTKNTELYKAEITIIEPFNSICNQVPKLVEKVNCLESIYFQHHRTKLIAIHLYVKAKKAHLTKIIRDWELKYLMTDYVLTQASKGVYTLRLFNISENHDQLMSQIEKLDQLIEQCERISMAKAKIKQENSPEDDEEEMPF